MNLQEMERQALVLKRDPLDDIMVLAEREAAKWQLLDQTLRGPVAAGETQNYHETRNPIRQTADYTAVTLAATSKSILGLTTDLIGGPLQFPAGYWEVGKKVHLRVFGKATTAATPGNLTIEIRHQTGTVTDAGGTILATSGAIAMGASKTNASWFLDVTVESRGMLGTASPLFAKGIFWTDATTALVASTVQPIFIPATAAAAVNVDTTLASTITVQWKRSGSTAETVTVQDIQVNSLT